MRGLDVRFRIDSPVFAAMLAVLAAASPLRAQAAPVVPPLPGETPASAAVEIAAAAPAAAPRSTLALVGGGLLGSAGGFWIGGLAGALVGGNQCVDEANPDSCRALDGFLVGAALGQALAVPLAVHWTNRSAGDLSTSLLVSGAATLAGLAGVAFIDVDAVRVAFALAIPVTQLWSAVRLERATSRAR